MTMPNSFSLRQYIVSDLYRCSARIDFKSFARYFFFNAGFKYLFWLRCSNRFYRSPFLKLTLFPISWFFHRRYMYKYGLGIPFMIDLGLGLKINHFSGIIINAKCKIGNNVTISHGVTLGHAERGKLEGSPIVGNEVFLGPGSKIFGNIRIGNNVSIGANAVVNFDVPDGAVVVGCPAKIVSMNGSTGYVKNKFYA